MLPFLNPSEALRLEPVAKQSGGGRSVVLGPCMNKSPYVMKCCINVMCYMCNFILIYTIGETAQ